MDSLTIRASNGAVYWTGGISQPLIYPLRTDEKTALFQEKATVSEAIFVRKSWDDFAETSLIIDRLIERYRGAWEKLAEM